MRNTYLLIRTCNSNYIQCIVHYNSPFTVTTLMNILNLHRISNNKYFSKMYIMVSLVCL